MGESEAEAKKDTGKQANQVNIQKLAIVICQTLFLGNPRNPVHFPGISQEPWINQEPWTNQEHLDDYGLASFP